MSKVRHLTRAPITEAVINFQVDASEHWRPTEVRSELSAQWPEFPEIQEIRPVQFKFTTVEGTIRQPEISFPPSEEGFMFLSPAIVIQARRDGYAFIQRGSYIDWQHLQSGALAYWHNYQTVLRPPILHGINVRFVNRLEFALEEFRLSKYFTIPPGTPVGLDWKFHGFLQHVVYAPPNSPCAVAVITSPAFVTEPTRSVAFALDIDVMLKEPFSSLEGRSMESVLSEMHDLKNQAFFNLLTEEAIKHYI